MSILYIFAHNNSSESGTLSILNSQGDGVLFYWFGRGWNKQIRNIVFSVFSGYFFQYFSGGRNQKRRTKFVFSSSDWPQAPSLANKYSVCMPAWRQVLFFARNCTCCMWEKPQAPFFSKKYAFCVWGSPQAPFFAENLCLYMKKLNFFFQSRLLKSRSPLK